MKHVLHLREETGGSRVTRFARLHNLYLPTLNVFVIRHRGNREQPRKTP